MTSVPAATISHSANNIASQSDRAGSPSVANSNPSVALPPAQQPIRSYAAVSAPTVNLPQNTSSRVASSDQHARSASVNTRVPSVMAASSTVNGAAPNGNTAFPDHSKKPSVTINAPPGYTPNGGPMSAGGRAQISFGQFDSNSNAGAVNNSAPPVNTLAASQHNPRVTTPAKSPSPIPQPPASGGRPPSGFQPQSGPPHFGAIGGTENGVGPSGGPQGPGMPGQPIHLRRQSSQQSDTNNPPFTPGGSQNRQYMGNQNRQRSFNSGGYNSQQFSASPASSYRPMPGMPQQRSGYPSPYPGQHNMPHMQQSPGPQRTPSHGGFVHGGQGSHPGTPQMYHQQMHGQYSQQPQQPPYQAFNQHPGQGSETFGMQPGYQQQYGYYQQQGYQMAPQYLNQQGPPLSPSPFRQAPPSARQQYQQQQFNNQPAHQMSRTPSHASTTERPGSSVGGPAQPPPSQTPSNNIRSHTPQQSKSEFTIPKRTGVVIKDSSGNVITFPKKEASSAAVVKSPPLVATPAAPISAAATPSPAATPAPGHTRADSKTGKTAEEIKAQFLASVKSSQSTGDKIEEEAATTTPLPAQEEATLPATGTAEAEAKAAKEKAESDDVLAKEKAHADEKAAKEKSEADAKAAKEKVDAEAKAADVKREREATEAALEKEQAEARAAAEREEKAKAEAATAKLEQEEAAEATKKADQAKAEEVRAAEATAPADSKPAANTDQPLSDEDAEFERQIAEMEAAEKAEAEREAAYAEKKKKATEEKTARDKAAAADPDAELKRQEREAEERELRLERERERAGEGEKDDEDDGAEDKEEDEMSFASLKKPTLGPGADSEAASDTATPASEESNSTASKAQVAPKAKPSPLKLDVNKAVEPPPQTPGMKSLVSARKLKIQSEDIQYPEGIQSPNPALNRSSKARGMVYEPAFLMQFADVFKEKPSVDWEQKLKETIGDTSEPQSARSARTPMTGKTPSSRGAPPPAYQGMGNFGAGPGGRTLPAGTTSADRFAASSGAAPGRTMTNPMASVGGPGRGGFQMGNGMMPPSRAPSMGGMSNPSRGGNSNRGGGSKRGQPPGNRRQEDKAMPLTAAGEVKALELSKTGWKPTSIGQPTAASQPDLSGHMAPDMVQRKVKSALNKMTPERFDKISDQILVIVAQSKDETDGRTLRQVIALIFEKACDEAHWAEMYARFCLKMLETMSSDIKDESILGKDGAPVSGGGLFRKYLLTRCQEDFEHGWEANLPEKPEGETEEAVMLSDEYYIAAAAKRKGLGLLQFIGELFKLRMLSIKIMHQCFMRLLDFEGMPDESTIESLTRLMKTVGATIDASAAEHGKGNQPADAAHAGMTMYFQRIDDVLKKEGLPSRMHFMLLDIVDLRKKGWATKDNLKGPTTIQQIREQAAVQQAADAARQAASRQQGRIPSGRGPNNQYGNQMQPPTDFRASTVSNNELRQLSSRRQASQQTSTTRQLGPTSMFSSRSASGRAPLGPGGALGRNASGAGTMANAEKKKEDTPAPAAANAFAALASLDGGTEAPATATPASTDDSKPNGS